MALDFEKFFRQGAASDSIADQSDALTSFAKSRAYAPPTTSITAEDLAPRPAQTNFELGSFLGGIGRGVENFTSGVQKGFNESGVGQFVNNAMDATQAPGNWFAKDILHAPDPGSPGSPEYRATQFLTHNATPTAEQVQNQSSQMNNFLFGSLGGGLKNVAGEGSLAGTARVIDTTARVGQVHPTAIEAPAPRLALPSGPYADPFMEAERRAAMTRPQQVADQLARQTPAESGPAIPQPAPAPISMGDLRPRPAETPPATATPIGGLTGRGIQTTPIGREDLTLRGARFAPPGTGEVAPVSRTELQARIGAPAGEGNLPLNADELSRRIGATPPSEAAKARTFADTGPAQMTAKDAFAREVEARQARVTGPIAESGMSGPLVGRAFGKGGSQLERAGRTGITAADLSASLERQSKVHNANEAAIAAMKSGDYAAAERAIRDVHLLGGDVNHTAARLKAAGVPAPSGAEIKRWLKASGGTSEVPAKAPTVPSGGGGLLNRLGQFGREDIGGGPLPGDKGQYGTPQEVRAAQQSAARRAYEARVTADKAAGTYDADNRAVGAKLSATSPSGTARIPNAPVGRGWLRTAEDISGSTKTLATALSPFHFMFRHALPFMASHPSAWIRGSVKGLGEGIRMTPAELEGRIQQMQKNLDANGVGNTYLGRPHLGSVGGEEAVASTFINRAPILGDLIRRAGQGFVQGLNEVRYEAVKGAINTSEALAKMGLVEKLTAADRRGIGDSINHFSGRGIDTRATPDVAAAMKAQRIGKPITADELSGINSLRMKQATVRLMNLPMMSPQLATARVRMLADGVKGFADIANNLRQGKPVNAVALERARLATGMVVGTGSLYLLLQAAGGKAQLDNPVSTGFGDVDIGAPGPAQSAASFGASQIGMGSHTYAGQNTFLNPTASESTLIRNVARFIVAIHDQVGGTKDLMKMEGAKQETSPMDVATRAVLSQIFTSPIAYPMAQFLEGFPAEPLNAVTPMPVGALLTGAGVQMPTVGGKPPAAPKAAPAPKKKP